MSEKRQNYIVEKVGYRAGQFGKILAWTGVSLVNALAPVKDVAVRWVARPIWDWVFTNIYKTFTRPFKKKRYQVPTELAGEVFLNAPWRLGKALVYDPAVALSETWMKQTTQARELFVNNLKDPKWKWASYYFKMIKDARSLRRNPRKDIKEYQLANNPDGHYIQNWPLQVSKKKTKPVEMKQAA